MSERHPATEQVLQWFNYAHLRPGFPQEISKACALLADLMSNQLEGPELTVGLRKLLEAKDCFVRAALDQP